MNGLSLNLGVYIRNKFVEISDGPGNDDAGSIICLDDGPALFIGADRAYRSPFDPRFSITQTIVENFYDISPLHHKTDHRKDVHHEESGG